MYDTLLTLEKDFFNLQYISDREWLDKILHDDFRECGRSGKLFDKFDTMEELLQCDSDRDIVICGFECVEINSNSWLVHYITEIEGKQIWKRWSDGKILLRSKTRKGFIRLRNIKISSIVIRCRNMQ